MNWQQFAYLNHWLVYLNIETKIYELSERGGIYITGMASGGRYDQNLYHSIFKNYTGFTVYDVIYKKKIPMHDQM